MSTLFGTKIKDTYDGLLKVSDNVGITSTKKIITDGLGNDSSVYISSEDFQISTFFYVDINSGTPASSKIGLGTSSPTTTLHIVGDLRLTARFYDSNNSTGTSNQVLSSTGSGTDWVTLSEIGGVDGTGVANKLAYWLDTETITYDNLLHWDSSNNRLGVGTATPQTKLEVNGSFRVSSGNEKYLDIDDGGYVYKIGDIDGGEGNSYLEIDANNSETNLYKSTLGIPTYIFHQGNTTTKFGFSTNDTFVVRTNDVERFSVNNSGVALAGGSRVTTILDEDDMASDSDTSLATQQSIKAFVESEIASVPSGLNFQGNWNADTNSPTLASSTGTVGHFYNVSTPGTTSLNGENDWKIGDWAVFVEAGGTDKWMKIDNTSVLSGVGSANKIAYWSNDSTLTYDTDFYVDGDTIFTTNLEASGTGNFDSGKVIIDNISGNGRIHGTSSVFLGGVSTTLVQLSAKLIPDADSTRDLGQSNRYWKDAYIDTITTTGNVTVGGDVTVDGSHLVLANGTTYATATDYLYIGGSGLDNADGAIYIGNKADGSGYGWRFIYKGSGSGNDNKLIIQSENAGSAVDALTFTQDGNATFVGEVTSKGLKLTENTTLYPSDASISYHSSTNAVYVNGAGNDGWLRLNASGVSNDVNAINIFGTNQGSFQTFKTGGSTRMFINSSGQIGIGTTSPSHNLQVVSAGNAEIQTQRTSGAGVLIQSQASVGVVGTNTNHRLDLKANNTSYMTITTSGRVGIGTSSPSQDLTLYEDSGDANFLISSNNGASQIFFGDTESDNIGKIDYDHSDDSLNLVVNSAERMRIDSSGNVGIGTTSPSTKLDVVGEISASDDINTTGKLFVYKTDAELRLKTTNNSTGTSLINFADPDDNDVGQIKYLHNNNEFQFRSTDALALTLDYDSATFAGTVTASSYFLGSSSEISLATTGSGTVFLRPNGQSTSGQMQLASTGNATFAGNITTGGDSSVLGGSGTVPLYVRSTGTVSYVQIQTSTTGSNTTGDGLTVGVNGSTAYVWQRENASLHLGTNDSSALTINSSQNVGIGTTSPTSSLDIFKSGNASLRVKANGSSTITIDSDVDNSGTSGSYLHYRDNGITKWTLYKETNNDFYLYNPTAGTYPIHAKANGHIVLMEDGNNLGVGVSSPGEKLSVAGKIEIKSGNWLILRNSDNSNYGSIRGASDTSNDVTINTNAEVIRFKQSGLVGIGTTSPSEKLEVEGNILVTSDSATSLKIQAKNSSSFNDPVLEFVTWDVSSGASSGKIQLTNGAWNNNDMAFYTETSNSVTEKMRITSTGSLKLNTYGSGTFTGTATQRLAVDSSGNIIEVPIGSGAVDGSGAANKLAIWSDTDTLTSNVNISVASGELQLGNGLLVEDNDTSVITAKAYEPHIVWQKTRGSGGDDYFKIKHENDASAVDFSLAQNGGSDVRIMRINNNNRVIVGGYNEYNASTLNVEGTFGVSTTSKFGGNAIFVSNVGIGETSIDAKLHISDGATANIKFERPGHSKWAFGIPDGQTYLAFDETNDGLTTPTMVLTRTTKRVGIGTTSPSKQLMLYGNTPFIRLEDDQGGNKRLDLWVDSNAVAHIDANQSASQITLRTASTDRLRITNAGNVGIGTTSPAEKLEVSGGHIKITNAGNTNLYINANNSGSDASIFFEELDSVKAKIQYDASNDSMLFTDGSYTDTMTLKGGKVGIGTTSPKHKLYVSGDIGQTDGSRIWFRGSDSSSGTGAQSYIYSNGLNLQIKGDDNVQLLGDGGGIILHADYSGKVGINNSSPSTTLDVSGDATISGTITSGNITTNSRITFDYGGDHYLEAGTNSLAFKTSGGSTVALIDYANSRVGIGSTAPAALLEIVGSGDAIRVESTNTGAAGAQIDLLQFTSSPADEDVHGLINFGGYYTGTTSAYATQIKSVWTDVSDRHGRLEFYTVDTSLNKVLTLGHDKKATFGGSVHLDNDSAQLQLGDDNDMQIYHNGANGVVDNNTGDLIIRCDSDDIKILAEDDVVIRDNDDSTEMAKFINGGAVELYHNGNKKIETTSGGVDVSGALYVDTGIYHNGDTNNYIYFSTDTQKFYTSGSERMRIDSSGRVGIGTTSLTEAFVVSGNIELKLNEGMIGMNVGDTWGDSDEYCHYGLAKPNGAEAMMLASYFGLKFGTNGSERLEIAQNGKINCGSATRSNTTSSFANMYMDSTSGEIKRSTSSRRYKTNIVDYTKGLDEVLQLQPKTYNDINGDSKQFAGLIAEDVHDLGLNEYVYYNENNEPDALGYSHMIALLTNAIKELKQENDDLKARVSALEK